MALRELHKIAPHIKMVVSFADMDQGHDGIIYQATNWIYLGKTTVNQKRYFLINGEVKHNKTIYDKLTARGINPTFENIHKYIDKNAEHIRTKGKHKYVFFFDKKLRKRWIKEAKPYPKGINNPKD